MQRVPIGYFERGAGSSVSEAKHNKESVSSQSLLKQTVDRTYLLRLDVVFIKFKLILIERVNTFTAFKLRYTYRCVHCKNVFNEKKFGQDSASLQK